MIKLFKEFLNEQKLDESNPQSNHVSEILKKLNIKHDIKHITKVSPNDIVLNLSGGSMNNWKENTKLELVQYPDGVDTNTSNEVIIHRYYAFGGHKGVYKQYVGGNWNYEVAVVKDINVKDKTNNIKLVKQINKVANNMFDWWYDF